jgi:tetratricopeptide (TPR) repeat protein
VHFSSVRNGCAPGQVDGQEMARVVEEFQAAANVHDPAPHVDIPVKSAFGAGRVRACLDLAGDATQAAEAESNLETVIHAYESGNARVRDLAAEAHFTLGYISLPFRGAPDAAQAYQRAESEFRQAISVSQNPVRRAYFASDLAFVHARLGQYDQAEQDYQNAMQLDKSHRDTYQKLLDQLRANRPTPVPDGP